jgi:hypothetical protein
VVVERFAKSKPKLHGAPDPQGIIDEES